MSLTRQVKASADHLAYPLRAAHFVERVHPWSSNPALQARVEQVWDETKDARTLTLRPGISCASTGLANIGA